MTASQAQRNFVFPERAEDFDPHARRSANTGARLPPSQPSAQPLTSTHIRDLVRRHRELAATELAASEAASSAIQLAIHSCLADRFHTCLRTFYTAKVDKRTTPELAKFAVHYQQTLELARVVTGFSGTVKTNASSSTGNVPVSSVPAPAFASPGFAAALPPGHRSLLNSFLTLIKSSPSFMSSALLSLSPLDLKSFITSRNTDAMDDLFALNRVCPVDILFYSIFSGREGADRERAEYFSSVCASMVDSRRADTILFAVLDRIMAASGHPFASAQENLVLSILQQGAFLVKSPPPSSLSFSYNTSFGYSDWQDSGTPSSSSTTDFARRRSSSNLSSSTPASATPSPEMGHAQLAAGLGSQPMAARSSSSLSSVDETASDEKMAGFLATATELVLDFLTNPATDAVPKQFVEFCRLLLSKVASVKSRQTALLTIVLKYLFHRHLHRVLVTPEAFGMFASSYISDSQRTSLLTPVYQKLYRIAAAACYDRQEGASSGLADGDPRLYARINSIMDLLSSPPPESRPSLFGLETDHLHGSDSDFEAEFYSPGELVVLSPSDFVCLYSALFPAFVQSQRHLLAPPENRPQLYQRSSPAQSPRASPLSQPLTSSSLHRESTNHHPNLHGLSNPTNLVLELSVATTATSFVSTNVINEGTDMRTSVSLDMDTDDSTINFDHHDQDEDADSILDRGRDNYEWSLDDIRSDLEPVMEHLVQRFPYLQFKPMSATSQYLNSLRPGKMSSFKLPHLSAERWQVFKVRDDGTFTTTDAQSLLEEAKLRKGTQMLSERLSSTALSDDLAVIGKSSRTLAVTAKRGLDKLIAELASPEDTWLDGGGLDLGLDPNHPEYIGLLLKGVLDRCMAKGEFIGAGDYSNALAAYQRLAQTHGPMVNLNSLLLNMVSKEMAQSLGKLRYQVEVCQTNASQHTTDLTSMRQRINLVLARLSDLRIKVWYVTEIRPSQLFSRARSVARALAGGNAASIPGQSHTQPQPPGDPSSDATVNLAPLKRNHSSSSIASGSMFSLKRFTSGSSRRDFNTRRQSVIGLTPPQSPVDGMFALRDFAGDHKLADREAVATQKWLRGQQIQNFCSGEERIHRLCCEIDDLVRRVMGDVLFDHKSRGHSLLSASPLFRSDLWRSILDLEGPSRSSTPPNNVAKTFSSANTGVPLSDSDDYGRPAGVRLVDRSQSVRMHRSQFSSPNLLDMFSSELSLSGSSPRRPLSTMSTHDSYGSGGYNFGDSHAQPPSRHKHDKSSSSESSSGHRRNKSLNDSRVADRTREMLGSGSGSGGEGVATDQDQDTSDAEAKKQKLDDLVLRIQMNLTGMIYSDLGMGAWFQGSETDEWFNSELVMGAVERHARSYRGSASNSTLKGPSSSAHTPLVQTPLVQTPLIQTPSGQTPSIQASPKFDYEDACRRILHTLSVTPSPYDKLRLIHSLVSLVVATLSSETLGLSSGLGLGLGHATPGSDNSASRSTMNFASTSSFELGPVPGDRSNKIVIEIPGGDSSTGGGGGGSSNNASNLVKNSMALTSVGEAIATVEAKRSSSGLYMGQTLSSPGPNALTGTGGAQYFSGGAGKQRMVSAGLSTTLQTSPNTDAIAEELQRILGSPGLKSPTLFRDLQLIASLVPQPVLDLTDMGKAFWDVGLAALSLKEDSLAVVSEVAGEIFQYKSDMITAASKSRADGSHYDAFLAQRTLADCAVLWTIAAKEGDVVGQRELAIMLLSHPQITPLSLAPFSKLADAFDTTVLDEYTRAMSTNEHDFDKLDPVRMAVVKHWMANAAQKGDNIANEYLLQQNPAGYI